MKEIVVISGKGGTGKTSIVSCFAAMARNAVLADCDVDAADLHLILKPDIQNVSDFSGGSHASIIAEKCIGCGRCEQVCNFNAIKFGGPGNDIVGKTFMVDEISCEGCKVCVEFCPVNAIDFSPSINGRWFISDTRFGPMVHAKLGAGQENSGKLVSLLRKEAKKLADEQNRDMVIVDGSPGVGCPVIASIGGAVLILVVTEPTISGQHDLDRVVELANHFKVPVTVCINKYDINPRISEKIEKKATEKGLKIAGKISYDADFTRSQIQAKSMIEYSQGSVKDQIQALWNEILNMLYK